MFFNFFGIYFKTALRIFSMFCMSLEDNRAHYLSKIVSLKKVLILDFRELNFIKKVPFYIFALYSKRTLRIFPIFCMKVEDKSAYYLCKIVFRKKFLIPDYRGLSLQKTCFFTSLEFTPKPL